MPISEAPPIAEVPLVVENLGSKLCTRCGLCCAGAIHNAAVLDEDEIPAARAMRLPVLDSEKPLFALPCPKLKNDCCTIYATRPRVCARYKCQLLQDLEAGAVALPEALDRVRTAKALFEQLKDAMPAGMTFQQTRRLALDATASPAGVDARTRMLVRLRSTALQLYLDKHFRNSDDNRLFELKAIGDPPMEMGQS